MVLESMCSRKVSLCFLYINFQGPGHVSYSQNHVSTVLCPTSLPPSSDEQVDTITCSLFKREVSSRNSRFLFFNLLFIQLDTELFHLTCGLNGLSIRNAALYDLVNIKHLFNNGCVISDQKLEGWNPLLANCMTIIMIIRSINLGAHSICFLLWYI